jgi:catechol 2,3-dioxygenase-like lactoylglutathione lyase family enzyme
MGKPGKSSICSGEWAKLAQGCRGFQHETLLSGLGGGWPKHNQMTRPEISGIAPFFIARDAAAALAFYRDRLEFEITFQEPAVDPFFGIVRRGGAMIILKGVGVDPLPNHQRQPEARWDAYVSTPDPDGLAAEFASRQVEFSKPLRDTHDGLRGFEVKDRDGYVLFFGCPRS